MSFLDDKITKHESYGSIGFNRVSGGTHLFGSDAFHHGFIRMEISEADMRRSLSDDRIYANKRLVVVDMTFEQFCQAITSFGIGMGTPCTLRMIGGKEYEDCPKPEHFASKFQEDLKKTVNEAVASLGGLVDKLQESNLPGNKPLGKKEQAVVLKDIERALMQIKSNIPFIEKQFDEMMEKKVSAAMIEVENVVAMGLRDAGLDAIRSKALGGQMPDYSEAFSVPMLSEGSTTTIETDEHGKATVVKDGEIIGRQG